MATRTVSALSPGALEGGGEEGPHLWASVSPWLLLVSCHTGLGSEARGPGRWLDTTSLGPSQKVAPGSSPQRVLCSPEALGWGMGAACGVGKPSGRRVLSLDQGTCALSLSLSLSLSVIRVQGEDGFPGFKGDMGIKGDRVSVPGRRG